MSEGFVWRKIRKPCLLSGARRKIISLRIASTSKLFQAPKEPENPCIKELISWCKKFSEIGILPKHGTAALVIWAQGRKKDHNNRLGNRSWKYERCWFCRSRFSIYSRKESKRNRIMRAFSESISITQYTLCALTLMQFSRHDAEVLKNAEKARIPWLEKEEPYGTLDMSRRKNCAIRLLHPEEPRNNISWKNNERSRRTRYKDAQKSRIINADKWKLKETIIFAT